MSAAVIETCGLHKRFGRVHAVRGIDLRVEPGTIHGLIGPNGAGKSTTMRMLVDIVRPSEGSVRVLGENPRHAPRLRRRIGYLPGEVKLTERSSGQRVLDHFARISGDVLPATVAELAERLDLDLTRPLRTLSKGNRQKLGLIQAFMHRPELLILDEPTSGLDPLMQNEFLHLIREARDNGQTVLLSSHILGEIQHTADAATVLARGTIVAEGDVCSLRLTGSSRLRVVVTGADASTLRDQLAALPEVTDVTARGLGEAVQASATLRGAPDAVLRTLTHYSVRDLTVEEPDLEQSVLELYSRQETP